MYFLLLPTPEDLFSMLFSLSHRLRLRPFGSHPGGPFYLVTFTLGLLAHPQLSLLLGFSPSGGGFQKSPTTFRLTDGRRDQMHARARVKVKVGCVGGNDRKTLPRGGLLVSDWWVKNVVLHL